MRPDRGLILLGPFWTRGRTARELHRSTDQIVSDGRILRLPPGIGLGETYPSFQFVDGSLRDDAAVITPLLRRRVDDLLACDWYVHPQDDLGGVAPLTWLGAGGDLEALLELLPTPDTTVAPEPTRPRTWTAEPVATSGKGYRTPWQWRTSRRRPV